MRYFAILTVIVLVIGLGCGSKTPAAPDAGAADTGMEQTEDVGGEFDIRIGLLKNGSKFESLGAGDVAEIVVGFQGLIFIDLALAGPKEIPDELEGEVDVAFEKNSSYDFSVRKNLVLFDMVKGKSKVCPQFRVPFGQDLSLLDGQVITVSVELEGDGWKGAGSAKFRIEDNEDGGGP